MNIVLVDCTFRCQTAHNVQTLAPERAGSISLASLLRNAGEHFEPDLICQRERLGPRVFLSDLDAFSCPKIFWSIDTHLNMFWHRYYARLFDMVLTPHKSLYDALPAEWAVPHVHMFTVPGYQRSWKAHASRSHFASFVGVRDSERPLRNALADVLQERHDTPMCSLPFAEMLNLYDDSCVIPNESICREINFRLFEGASSGCCVLMPDIGDDLGANFESQQEVLTYQHVLELDEILLFLRRRPDVTEKIGKAAQQRIQSCHLPEHRLATLVELAGKCAPQRLGAEAATRNLLLAKTQHARSNPSRYGQLPVLTAKLQHCQPHPDVFEMLLRLALEDGHREMARALADKLLRSDAHAGAGTKQIDLNLLCAVAAFRLDDEKLFVRAWQRQFGKAPVLAEGGMRTCFSVWAKFLAQKGRLCQPGFQYDPKKHCPQTALELLLMVEPPQADREGWRNWLRDLVSIGEKTPLKGHYTRYCQQLANEEPTNWKHLLRTGLAQLDAYMLDAGLASISNAATLACQSTELENLLTLIDKAGITLEQVSGAWQRKADNNHKEG